MNAIASFNASENEKGLVAKEVKIDLDRQALFVAFGDVRIKLSNIKSYGMTKETRRFEIQEDESKSKRRTAIFQNIIQILIFMISYTS